MLDLAARAHIQSEQDFAQIHRLTLQAKHYHASGAERVDLAVALADNHTEQMDLRAAYALAGGYTPDQLDRNGLTAGHNWTPVRPTPHEQAMAYVTEALMNVEYGDGRPGVRGVA